MAYTKTTWRNNQSPAINADNLNHIEEGVYEAHQDIAENTQNIESLTTQTGANTSAIALEKTQRQQADTAETLARENADNLLSARMDTFTQLPSGSTSGDAELIDIRVGADGVTYPTAGDAVRGQVTDLKSELTYSEVGNDFIGQLYNGYWDQSGTRVSYNGDVCNEAMIPCPELARISIRTSTTAAYFISYFDSNNTRILRDTGNGTSYDGVSPNGTVNICFTFEASGITKDNFGSVHLYINNATKVLSYELNGISYKKPNLMMGFPSLPKNISFTSTSNQANLFNSVGVTERFVLMKPNKVYLAFVKFDIESDDTSTQGTARLVNTKKGTTGTEPTTISSRKDVDLATAEKGSSQIVFNISTVSEDTYVFYKIESYSSGTSSRSYHLTINELGCYEFNTEAEAKAFYKQYINATTQDGFLSSIDTISRRLIGVLSQLPYDGKSCCVVGDSLSAAYYDMWVSYFADKTGINAANMSVGGTSVAVRDGYTSSFVERISAISDEYDVWIIFGGMNDKDGVPIGDMTSTSTSTFYGAYKAILSDLQTRSNHPQVIMIAPYYNVDAILPYIDVIRDIAEHYGVPLVDLSKISGVNPTTRSIYTRDWTHPNQLLCDRIRPQITRELCEKIIFAEETEAMPH